ncbi:hypothetical protein NIES2100_33660 [Calothrix sp. NIES-2100]|uniref:calcium-binding protein n=1 Tax=Calothrix sp. NIES-2100 TaxID=1954172 RepID=UPI000B5E58F2|nr:hypothetical protein NIES2100_33660 [Calothrix sp. NIES-2100]
MTTTPTFWGNEVTFSFDLFAFSPKVTALSDNTFAIAWENGTDIFGRHLNSLGSFMGGDFLYALPTSISTSTDKALSQPFIVQQADGKVVVNYNELFASGDNDIRWHSPNPNFTPNANSSVVTGLRGRNEILLDTTARSNGVGDIGTATVYLVPGLGTTSNVALDFVDKFGNFQGGVLVDPRDGESQQNAAIAGRHTGHVVVAYEVVNQTTFAREVRFQSYAANGMNTGGGVVSASNANAAFPDVVALRDGTFVVAWQQVGNGGIAFRRYFGEGTPIDDQPRFVSGATGLGLLPKLTALNDGGFMIAWTDTFGRESDGSPDLDVVMQRFNASGTEIGTRLDIRAPGDQGFFGMSIATLDDGRVILTYQSETGDSTNITTLNYRIVDPRDSTIVGSNEDDNIVGREDASLISGLDGKDNIIGRAGNDTLDGGVGNDTLDGGAGNDSLLGGAGNDLYIVDAIGDVVNETAAGSGGIDTVQSSISYTLGSNVENLTLTGSAAINGTGNTLNNIINGNSANNSLIGGDGNDTLSGGAGNDVLNGGSGADMMIGGSGDDNYLISSAADVVTELASEGIDTVVSNISYALGANVENLTLTNAAVINGTGNDLNNYILGNAAANIINANGGNDQVNGRGGDDSINGGLGNDTLSGDIGNDTLLGSTGNDVLFGNDGNDNLNGGDGNDILTGGKGNDILVGGLGADKFSFSSPSETIDIIKDFNRSEGDKIQISARSFGATSLNQFSYNSSTGGLFFDASPSDNVSPLQLTTIENKPAGFSTQLDIILV